MPPKPRLIEVLLIEDNPGDVHLIREGLKQSVPDLRLNLRTAADGEEALAILIDEGYRPDMVLLDLSLPNRRLKPRLQRIRSHGIDLASTPVIVFSSTTHGIQEVLDAEANAYIVKPTGLVEYLRAIVRFAVLWLKPKAAELGR